MNYGDDPVAVDLRFAGCSTAPGSADVVSLQGQLTDQNTPANKRNVWPKPSRLRLSGGSASYTFPATSFTTVMVNCTVTRWLENAADRVAGSTCAFVPPPPPPPPPPAPPPPAPFTWAGRSMVPSGLNGWQVNGDTLLWTDGVGHGRAVVAAVFLLLFDFWPFLFLF